MTLLGEFVLPLGGSAWTQTFVAALDQLGVRDKAARQALARTEDRGWLRRERVGRKTRWILTEDGVDLLTTGAERIYGFGNSDRSWDGRWVVLLASVPEGDRATRYRMGQELGWAGFGPIGQGVWISPWVEQEPTAVSVLSLLGVQATSFVAQVGQLGSSAELAGQAWDLPALDASYQHFLDVAADVSGEPVARLTRLVHEWRRLPFLDPNLPSEVLSSKWLAPTAATVFGDVRSSLIAPARQWWAAVDETNN